MGVCLSGMERKVPAFHQLIVIIESKKQEFEEINKTEKLFKDRFTYQPYKLLKQEKRPDTSHYN